MTQQPVVPEFSDLVLACRHHVLLTGVTGIIVAFGLAAIAWWLVDPHYQVESLVRVREQQSVVFAAQTTRADDSGFFRAQPKLVQSPPVIAVAIQDDAVREFVHEIPKESPVDWVTGLLRANAESGSEMLSIKVQHRSPRFAHALCNAVTKAYLAEITTRLAFDRAQREQELQQAVRAADEQLDGLWDKLNLVAQSVGSDSSASMTIRDELQFQAYRDHARQLQSAQLRGNQLQSQLVEKQLELDQQVTSDENVVESLLEQRPEIVSARKQLSLIILEIEQMRMIAASDDSPQMKRLTDQRDFFAAQLNQLLARVRSQLRESSQTLSLAQRQKALADLKQQIDLNRSEKEFLRDQLSELESVVSRTVDKTAVPLDMSRHAIERQSRLADRLWQSLQELRIEAQSQPRITLFELANLPNHASHSRQLRAAAAAALSGLLLIVFGVGYFEWRDCRVRFPDDVSSRSRFPVFGAAFFSSSQSNSLSGSKQKRPTAGVSEAAAKVILRREQGHAAAPSMMVTSCVATEPRHLVSLELAVLLGGFRRRILLVDCDTDQSQLSQTLGAEQLPGMRQLSMRQSLRNASQGTRDAITQLVVQTELDEVDVLPLGPMDDSQSWVDPRTLRWVIDEMRSLYDAIIVNGPSMMGSAEGLLLAAEVDTSVFSIFMNRSRWNQLVLCEESACQVGISISGSILHRGKGQPNLRLRPEHARNAQHDPRGDDDKESELRLELDELQQEIHRAQSTENRRSPTDETTPHKRPLPNPTVRR